MTLVLLSSVVLDRRKDKNADTGAFQLLYRATAAVSDPPYTEASFCVQGRRIKRKGVKR